MSPFNKFNSITEALAEKVHNFGADTLKFMLTNVAPVATNTIKANLTEIAGGNGYTAGGHTITISSSSQTGGTYTLVAGADVTITASGGSIGPFRYVAAYNDTATNDELVSWYDYGSSITVLDGENFKIASNGVTLLQIA